jgi:hypothetical protein
MARGGPDEFMRGLTMRVDYNAHILPRGMGTYNLWLACGHEGGTGKSGYAVTRRMCKACKKFQAVTRVEPAL